MEKPAHQRGGSDSSNRIMEMIAVHVKLKEVTATVAASCVDEQSMMRLHAVKRSFTDFPATHSFALPMPIDRELACARKSHHHACGLQLQAQVADTVKRRDRLFAGGGTGGDANRGGHVHCLCEAREHGRVAEDHHGEAHRPPRQPKLDTTLSTKRLGRWHCARASLDRRIFRLGGECILCEYRRCGRAKTSCTWHTPTRATAPRQQVSLMELCSCKSSGKEMALGGGRCKFRGRTARGRHAVAAA